MTNACNNRLRRRILLLVTLILLIPTLAGAGQVNFESKTMLRVFERNTTLKEDALVLPLYEYLHGRVGSACNLEFQVTSGENMNH